MTMIFAREYQVNLRIFHNYSYVGLRKYHFDIRKYFGSNLTDVRFGLIKMKCWRQERFLCQYSRVGALKCKTFVNDVNFLRLSASSVPTAVSGDAFLV